MNMSAEWLHRLQLECCDKRILDRPYQRHTRLLSAVRETTPEDIDRRRWQFRDAVVSFETHEA